MHTVWRHTSYLYLEPVNGNRAWRYFLCHVTKAALQSHDTLMAVA